MQALCSLGKDLVRVPISLEHYGNDRADVFIRDRVLEQIAHAIDKYCFRHPPLEWFEELVRNKAWREPMFVRMARNSAEAFSERLGVAVLAAGADFQASTHGIPRRLGPLDFGMFAQNGSAL